ncbi:hypothetical protein HKO22_09670 [Peptoniphilus sp. AGMB00490]|uniref:Uncharacterized protein n=1 Tax=Peptoniphilus faecalis TaxID=2731255 RepID=A0A848RGP2_9FIRM|nr:hypothetical protein [Peptoniphilus faecalis]NMW85990.1 hypothetical protein [Peptoniphilus faecalis]
MTENTNLTVKFAPYTDEIFKNESRTSLLTNNDFDWTGARSVRIWKFKTAKMNDYARNIFDDNNEPLNPSRYGKLYDLNAETEEMLLKKDRSFIFNIDKLDVDETQGQLETASALARQLREVVIPERDKYIFEEIAKSGVIINGESANKINPDNIYANILKSCEVMDGGEVPDTDIVLVVTPEVYSIIKQAKQLDNTDVGADLRTLGVIAMLDGMKVIKVSNNMLPKDVKYMIVHPSATVTPVKLEDYNIHNDTPLASGDIVTGRICYDAFVLENKKDGIVVYKETVQ